MAINKTGTVNQVRIFALAQLSSVIYRMHQHKTLRSIAADAKVNAGTLGQIKNGTIRSISLNRIMDIMDNLNVNYVMQIQRRKGTTHYSFALDRHNVRKSDSNRAEVSYEDELAYIRNITVK